jgi:CHAT domain-containing protein
LPLHAAWRGEPNTPTGRTYAVDLAALSYTPNARALRKCDRSHELPVVDQICIIANPSTSTALDLPGAEREGEDVARFFDSPLVLRGSEASKQNVLALLQRASILHFACHGYADLAHPLNSGLFAYS